MSVVVRLADGRTRLICKGAADALFSRCDHYELDGDVAASLACYGAAVIIVAVWLPSSPLGSSFGFAPLPAAYWPFLVATAVAYACLTHFAKAALVRRGWLEM